MSEPFTIPESLNVTFDRASVYTIIEAMHITAYGKANPVMLAIATAVKAHVESRQPAPPSGSTPS